MIDTAGAFILILWINGTREAALATQEMPSFEACKAAQVQLDPLPIETACIAAGVTTDQPKQQVRRTK